MKNRSDRVLYVGKAKDLHVRVRQYLVPGRDARLMIPYLITEAEAVETIVVKSEVEALLLENTLIKRHQPKFNVLLKDDKGFSGIYCETTHPWPSLRFLRVKHHPPRQGLFFGPYINSLSARQSLEFAHRVFPLRQCSDEELARRQKPCLLYHMKRCLAPCVNFCSKEEYQQQVASAIRFLKGDRKMAISLLEQSVARASDMLDFERAAQLHNMLTGLQQLQTGQGVDNPKGGNCDAFGLHTAGEATVVTRAQYRGGKLMGMQHRALEQVASTIPEIYETLLPQLYEQLAAIGTRAELPKTILIDEPQLDVGNLSRALTQTTSVSMRVRAPRLPEERLWVGLAEQNAAAQFQQTQAQRRSRLIALEQLQRTLQLRQFPAHIECIDQSHLGATGGVSAIVAFRDGETSKRDYRRYKVDDWAGDDYAALQSALKKRLDRAEREGAWPSLLLIDGGRAHLNAAKRVLESSSLIGVELAAISKEKGRHDRGLTAELIHLSNGQTLRLEIRSSPLLFLQRIRDEAHRFAIEYQKKRRSKALTRSILDDIPGIGATTKKKLLRHFGSLAQLKRASAAQLDEVPGLPVTLKTRLCEVLELPARE